MARRRVDDPRSDKALIAACNAASAGEAARAFEVAKLTTLLYPVAKNTALTMLRRSNRFPTDGVEPDAPGRGRRRACEGSGASVAPAMESAQWDGQPIGTGAMLASFPTRPRIGAGARNARQHRAGSRYLANLESGGGTLMVEGVKVALDFPHDPSRLRFVSFMTDGYIGNESDILAAIHRRLGASRIFSFGVGESVNRYLLERMAKTGRGVVAYLGLPAPSRDNRTR